MLQRGDKRALLSQIVIYRVLSLVIILDRVPKHMQLPQQAPFVFRMNAVCKSSEQILMDCLHSSLSGIGKLSRYLAKFRYTVDLVQRDVDEWPLTVSSIAHDLSNGIILCKLVSVLFGQVGFCLSWPLCHKPDSRLTQLSYSLRRASILNQAWLAGCHVRSPQANSSAANHQSTQRAPCIGCGNSQWSRHNQPKRQSR
jgi:hypothetical protein